MDFHLVKLGARPLLAVPGGARSLWAAAIGCYPAHTRKKRVVRQVLHGLARIGLIRRVFSARKLSLPGVGEVDFEAWMGTLCEQLRVVELHPVLVWPADPLRGRVYIYVLNKKGERLGFCKLGLDAKNNALIDRERVALETLHALKLSRIPKLLAAGDLNGYGYVVVETIPANTRVIDWNKDPAIDAPIEEFAGETRHLPREQVELLPWWIEFRRIYAGNTTLMQAVNRAVEKGMDVCLAHGDLNRTNVFLGVDDLWLLDWEQSDHNAPCLTDKICVAVDTLWLTPSADPAGNLQRLMQLFPELDDQNTRGRGVLALSYLATAGFTPAQAMLEQWFPVQAKAPGA